MMKVFVAACALAVAWQPGIVHGQTPVERAWTILEQQAASEKVETRIAAVEALSLLIKDDRARRLAESKLTAAAAIVRLGRGTGARQ